MKNITIKLASFDQANKALIKLGQAANKVPEMKIPPTKLQKFARAFALYISTHKL